MKKIVLLLMLASSLLFTYDMFGESDMDDFKNGMNKDRDAFFSEDPFGKDTFSKKEVKVSKPKVRVQPTPKLKSAPKVQHDNVVQKQKIKPTPKRVVQQVQPAEYGTSAYREKPVQTKKRVLQKEAPVKTYVAAPVFSTTQSDKVINVSVIINRSDYSNKSMINLKKVLMQQAKLEAASKIFGDFIKSETIIKDGSLVKDLIFAKQGGIIHIKGNPHFQNAQKFGSLKLNIQAFATPEDIKDMQVHRIEVKNFVYTNRNLNTKQLKQAAKDAFLIEAISKKKPSIKDESNAIAKARKLAVSVKIEKMKFEPEYLMFKMSGYVEYIPIFLRGANGAGAVSSKVIKNRAHLITYSSSGKMKEFDLKYVNGKMIFNKEAFAYIKRETQNHLVTYVLHAKLMIPKDIKTDTVTIQGNEDRSYSSEYSDYYTLINARKIAKGESASVNIINDNGLRYVKLTIHGRAYKKRHKGFINLVEKLQNITFSEIDSSKPRVLSTFVFKQNSKDSVNNKALLRAYSESGKVKTFMVKYDGNGILLSKEAFRFFQKETQQHKVAFSIHSRLIIPKEITTDTVSVYANGDHYYDEEYSRFYSNVNERAIKFGESASVNVINDNGIRYINLITTAYLNKEKFNGVNYVIRELGIVNFMATDTDDGEKFYALKSKRVKLEENINIKIDVYKDRKNILKSKIFKASYTGIGTLFSKKAFNYVHKQSQTHDVAFSIKMKLLVPKEIKTETISIQANEASHGSQDYSSFKATINGTEISRGKTASLKILQNNGVRYVEFELSGWASQTRFNGFKNMVTWMGAVSFIGSDTLDSEKWYKLEVTK